VLSAFLSGPGSTTLPLVVFSRVRLGLNPEMNALATLFIAIVTIGVILVNALMLGKERRRVRDMQLAFATAKSDMEREADERTSREEALKAA
jgi:putrescine transport system permease protein